MKCLCCFNEFDEYETNYSCDYCGFENWDTLGEQIDDAGNREIDKYRNNLLNRIQNITVKAKNYRWNDTKKEFEVTGTNDLFQPGVSGKECFDKYVTSDIALSQLGAGMSQEVEVNYTMDGKPKKTQVTVKVPEDNKDWRMRVGLNKNLHLYVRLGADSTPGELKLI